MFMDILVAGLLALVSFRSGMEYQKYRRNKADIEAFEKRIEALKNDKPKDNSFQKEMIATFLENMEKLDNPEEARKYLEDNKKPEESGNVE